MQKCIEEVYWIIDEVVKWEIEKKKKGRKRKLTASETLTLLVMGHWQGMTTDKQLYELMSSRYQGCFSKIPSYAQFTRSIRAYSRYFDLVIEVLTTIYKEKKHELYIIDSTALPVSGYNGNYVKWIGNEGGIGKNLHGWYYGFKLHIIVNSDLEIVSTKITSANVHDIQVLKHDSFIKHIKGILVGDKGYQARQSLKNKLAASGIKLLVKQRNNMDPFLNAHYKKYFDKRRQIEGIFSYLKLRVTALYRFSRSIDGFLANVKAAVVAYILRSVNMQHVLC